MLLLHFYLATLVATQLLEQVTAVGGPVIIWNINEEESVLHESMGTVTSDTFSEIIQPFLRSSTLIAFAVKNLSRADLRCKDPFTEGACLSKVSGFTPRIFLNDVEDAKLTMLEEAANKTNIIISEYGYLLSGVTCSPGTVNVLTFAADDDGPKSSETLKKLDANISRIFNDNDCLPATFFLLSDESADTAVRTRSTPEIFVGKHFVLYVKKAEFTEKDMNPVVVQIKSISTKSQDGNITVTLDTDTHPIVFNVPTINGYYTVEEFKYGDRKYKLEDVIAPHKMSYYAGHLHSEAEDESVFEWHRFQIEVRHPEGKPGGKFKFSSAWHQVGFFTTAILSGLMVAVILGGIAMCGVTWLMDVNAVTQFDDPTGRTIQVRAE